MRIPYISDYLDSVKAEARGNVAIIESEAVARGRAEAVQELSRQYQLMATVPAAYPQTGGSPFPLYGYDRPIWYATPNSPRRRPDSPVTIDLIRQFADNYDILRSVINHLKREVAAQPFDIVSKDPKDDSATMAARIKEASLFFTKKGGLGLPTEGRRHFEEKFLEDLLVTGAFAVWKGWSKGGRLQEMLAIDSATIRPRQDAYGWPGPGDAWYEQWIMGMKIRDFKARGYEPGKEYKQAEFKQNELVYDGLWPMTWTPWFRSPVEYLITTVMSALASDKWNRSWLTTGTTPSDVIFTPESWTVDENIKYKLYFDAMLTGNIEGRTQTKLMPGGVNTKATARKDQDFADFDLWLARRTGAIFDVQLSSIGFAGEQYKVSQEGSNTQTTRLGVASLLAIRKELYDEALEDLGFSDLEINDRESAEETPLEQTRRIVVACGVPPMKLNEGRKALGLDATDDGDTILVSNTLTPLSTAVNPPEPVAPSGSGVNPLNPEGKNKDVSAAEELGRASEDLEKWQKKCLNRLREGRYALCTFDSDAISRDILMRVSTALETAVTPDDVRAIFKAL